VEGDPDASGGIGQIFAGEGTAYGGRFYEDFGQVLVTIADMA
jgi:hypothetical protein